MHTRRLASLLIGAWLLGSLLTSFVITPAMPRQTEAIVAAPPSAVAKDIEDLGIDVARLMLKYQASEAVRFVHEIWGIIQLGIAASLLATVTFTAHRSRFLVIAALVMAALACLQVLYLEPTLRATGRHLDFLPLSAHSLERDTNHNFQVWAEVLELIKLLAGFVLAGRLVIDFYVWQDRAGERSTNRGSRRRRRRKRTSDGSVAEPVVDPATDGAPASD
jgi:hypothetical protein